MDKKIRLTIVAVVAVAALLIFFFPQIKGLLGNEGSNKGEIVEKNIFVALDKAQKQNKPIFIDFYGAY